MTIAFSMEVLMATMAELFLHQIEKVGLITPYKLRPTIPSVVRDAMVLVHPRTIGRTMTTFAAAVELLRIWTC